MADSLKRLVTVWLDLPFVFKFILWFYVNTIKLFLGGGRGGYSNIHEGLSFRGGGVAALYFINNSYCLNRAYQNACQNDLWDAMTEQAQKDRVMDNTLTVKDVMDTWILQSGFPVVNVTRDYQSDTLNVSQVYYFIQFIKRTQA